MSGEDTHKQHLMLIEELGATTMQLGRLMTARHGQRCADGALSPVQDFALMLIAEHEPLKAGDLATHLGVKPPAASSVIDLLEKAGVIERQHADDDRRVSLLSVTEDGRNVLRSAERARRMHLERYASVLSEEDLRAVVRINRTLIDAMTDGTI